MQLNRVAIGLRNQREPMGESDSLEALKEFADDELNDSGSHKWTSEWYPFQSGWCRSWKTHSGRHGGSYEIKGCVDD